MRQTCSEPTPSRFRARSRVRARVPYKRLARGPNITMDKSSFSSLAIDIINIITQRTIFPMRNLCAVSQEQRYFSISDHLIIK